MAEVKISDKLQAKIDNELSDAGKEVVANIIKTIKGEEQVKPEGLPKEDWQKLDKAEKGEFSKLRQKAQKAFGGGKSEQKTTKEGSSGKVYAKAMATLIALYPVEGHAYIRIFNELLEHLNKYERVCLIKSLENAGAESVVTQLMAIGVMNNVEKAKRHCYLNNFITHPPAEITRMFLKTLTQLPETEKRIILDWYREKEQHEQWMIVLSCEGLLSDEIIEQFTNLASLGNDELGNELRDNMISNLI